MKTTHAKITTDYSRELTVKNSEYDVNLHVKDTDGFYAVKGEVYTGLTHGEAAQLAAALVGENATVITDLPGVEVDSWGDLTATGTGISRAKNAEPDRILSQAKALLAIHAFIVKRNAEQEEAKKAEAEAVKAKEAANAKRRDELASQFGNYAGIYSSCTGPTQRAIDHIIKLEEAAKVS